MEVWDVRHEEGQPVGRQSVVVISGGGQLGGSRPGDTNQGSQAGAYSSAHAGPEWPAGGSPKAVSGVRMARCQPVPWLG